MCAPARAGATPGGTSNRGGVLSGKLWLHSSVGTRSDVRTSGILTAATVDGSIHEHLLFFNLSLSFESFELNQLYLIFIFPWLIPSCASTSLNLTSFLSSIVILAAA